MRQSAATPPLRILTWNTWLQPGPNPHAGKRVGPIGEKLSACDRDLLLLQKVWAERDTLVGALEPTFGWLSDEVNPAGWPRVHSGLLTASRVPLDLLGSIDFKAAAGGERLANKGAALWQGDWHGYTFQIASVHLQGHDPVDTAEEARTEQLSELRRLLDRHREHSVPQIVCGDFSIASGSFEHEDALEILDAKDEGPFTGQIPHTSYPRGDEGLENDIGRDFVEAPETLDYILLRRVPTRPLVTIRRSVRRYREEWRAGFKTYQDLAYRYCLLGEITFERPAFEVVKVPVADAVSPALRVAIDHVL